MNNVTLPVQETAARLGHQQISERSDESFIYLNATRPPSFIHHILHVTPEKDLCQVRTGYQAGIPVQTFKIKY